MQRLNNKQGQKEKQEERQENNVKQESKNESQKQRAVDDTDEVPKATKRRKKQNNSIS